MTNFVYFARTAVGTFWIKPDRKNRWTLSIENDGDTELLGFYVSAAAAAEDVATQHSGCDEWDIPSRTEAPSDLGEWDKRPMR